MPSDKDLISTEEQDLNDLLGEWNKGQTKQNRTILTKKIIEFKSLKTYTPHNRKQFYSYVADNNIKDLLKAGTAKRSTATTGSKTTSKISIKLNDLFNEIQQKAYELFCHRITNSIPGNHMEDWLKAEQEMKKKYKIK